MKKSIFLVTRTRWTELPRIRHEICWELAKFYNVFFIEAPVEFHNTNNTQLTISEIGKNIKRVIVPTLYKIPNAIKRYEVVIGILNNIYAAHQIIQFAKEKKKHSIVLINFNYDFFSLMSNDVFKGNIYFCNDDFVAQCHSVATKKIVHYLECLTVKRADICLSNHQLMVERMKAHNKNSHIFLQAHNFNVSTYQDISSKKSRKSARIRAAYMGFIDTRLDHDCLKKLSEQPDIELHMIGPNNTDRAKRYGQQTIFHGAKKGNELEALLRTMDVLLMPFNENSCMRLCSSTNKLFKYIAVGKPVVVTGMPHCISFSQGIVYKVAHCNTMFIDTVRQAYKEDCELYQIRRAEIALENSWEKRIVFMKKIVEDFYEKSSDFT